MRAGVAVVCLVLGWACAKGGDESETLPSDGGAGPAGGGAAGGSDPVGGSAGTPAAGGGGDGGSGGSAGGGGAAGGGGTAGGGGAGGSGGCTPLDGCGIDDPNSATRCSGGTVISPIAIPPGTVWASSVVQFSSEYSTTTWSANQALAAPNTYPSHGDLNTAWATLSMDAANEFITVAFPAGTTGSMVWIFETYNPDAVGAVTVTTSLGSTVVYQVTPVTVGGCAYVLGVPTQTTDPILEVRIDLRSELVSSWNEIDAVGVVP